MSTLLRLAGGLSWQVWALAGLLALAGTAYAYHWHVVTGLEAETADARARASEYRAELADARTHISRLEASIAEQNRAVDAMAQEARQANDAATLRALRELRAAQEATGEAAGHPTGAQELNQWLEGFSHPSQRGQPSP